MMTKNVVNRRKEDTMAIWKCESCGFEKEGRCKPKKCEKCATGPFVKKA